MNDNSAKGLSCQSEVIGLLITLTHARCRYLDAAAAAGRWRFALVSIIHVSPFYAYLYDPVRPPADVSRSVWS